jgi:hypothetical protein
VPFRFVATATPSPNEYIEILAYAAFLGIMDVGQAKTRFFKRNSEKADALTLHPHKEREFWLWVASWALFVQKPSDLGFSDEGYALPALDVRWHELPSDHSTAGAEKDGQGACSATPRSACRTRRARSATACRRASRSCSRSARRGRRCAPDHLARPRGRARAIEAAVPGAVSVYGSQDLDEREKAIIDFSDGEDRGARRQAVDARQRLQLPAALLVGGLPRHRLQVQRLHPGDPPAAALRQPHQVRIDLIYTEAEREVRRELERKWPSTSRWSRR